MGFSRLYLIPISSLSAVFQSLGRDSVGFSQNFQGCCPALFSCFNPSVGILWGLAKRIPFLTTAVEKMFQSLGRDSVGFSPLS